MPSPRPLIHVGYSKTATTFLQTRFFAQHPGVSFLGQPTTDPAMVEWMRRLRWHDALQYDPTEAEALRDAAITPTLAGDKPAVISNEGFTVMNAADRLLIAQRLHQHLPSARVLITIREQASYVESLYHALIEPDVYALRSYPTFKRFVSEDMGSKPARSHIHGACFDTVVDCYQSLFGTSSVLVLPMERLKADPAGYFTSLCAFMEIDTFQPENRTVNPRLSRRSLAAARWSGRSIGFRWLCSAAHRASPRGWRKLVRTGRPATTSWPEAELEQARALFADSNAKLAGLTQLDLGSMGYAMP